MESEKIRKQLQQLISNFEEELQSDNLRKKSVLLSPAFAI